MKPYLALPFGGEIYTNTLLIILSFLGSLVIFRFVMLHDLQKQHVSWKSLGALMLGTSLSAFIGARLFHVLLERPQYFWENPELIFTQFNGMTFYGALVAGCAFVLFYQSRIKWGTAIRQNIWDAGTLCTCLTLGLMRMGCFANGCCWGKISSLPWAVQYYDERSVMPYKGIPVHPVQLYDAALGLGLGIVLWILWREGYARGRLFLGFALLYPVTRFFTEYFRADSYRGEDILMGLSMSQLISVFLFGGAIIYFFKTRPAQKDS